MTGWFLSFTNQAESDFDRLEKKLSKRVVNKLNWLRNNFDKITPLSLGGNWKGYYKLRIGDWRIIYRVEWEKQHIIVYIIENRDKVYKKK